MLMQSYVFCPKCPHVIILFDVYVSAVVVLIWRVSVCINLHV